MIDALQPSHPPAGQTHEAALHRAAEEMEAAFLAEMLKPMGANQARTSFGGGIGEEQFSSFLAQEQAELMVKAGGIGLAESIFDALLAAEGGAEPDAGRA